MTTSTGDHYASAGPLGSGPEGSGWYLNVRDGDFRRVLGGKIAENWEVVPEVKRLMAERLVRAGYIPLPHQDDWTVDGGGYRGPDYIACPVLKTETALAQRA